MEPIKTQTIWVPTKEHTDYAVCDRSVAHIYPPHVCYVEKKSDMVVMTNDEQIKIIGDYYEYLLDNFYLNGSIIQKRIVGSHRKGDVVSNKEVATQYINQLIK